MEIRSREENTEEHTLKIDWLQICLTMDALCDARLQVWTRWGRTMVVMVDMEMEMAAARVCGWRWRWCSVYCQCSPLASPRWPFDGIPFIKVVQVDDLPRFHAIRALIRSHTPVWNIIFCSIFAKMPPVDSFFLHFPSFPFPHMVSSLFSPFLVETHQSEDLWNPLHSLVISTNTEVNISF